MFEGRYVGRAEAAAKEDFGYVETDPTRRYGRFAEVLGKGATKTVYRAFDETLGMEVAWNQAKLNDVLRSPEELQRLYSEVHLLSTLKHDSIIRFYASWINVEKRTFNFITEMFTSGTLREYRHRYNLVDIRAVKNWARQILHGLVYLHGHDPPVIHRDIKCDNIFVNGHLGQVKIGDLGLAAILRGSQAAHSVIGTPEFMAPELYEEEYNELVDIYSFGMCVLEMLTSEYPYSECLNPAQIYKKVTSGKLPDAFYRVHDSAARQFIGKCLESASKRLPAQELLLDPFLSSDDCELLPIIKCEAHELINNEIRPESPLYRPVPSVNLCDKKIARTTDMTITGKMNPEDDTIFLKVQIADKDGNVKNIYFPFDTTCDTPIDVATEMVKELEITDREPSEIAEVINEEISALAPHWKEWEPPQRVSFSYYDEDDVPHHPCYSPSTSSQASFYDPVHPHGPHYWSVDEVAEWHQDDFLADDETSSQSSQCSGKYSNVNYVEHDSSTIRPELHPTTAKSHKPSRFCPEESQKLGHLTSPKRDSKRTHNASGHRAVVNRCISRIRSMVDIRSQSLHRSLVEEVNKRRLFKTVDAVENIGFQAPCPLPRKGSPNSKRNNLTWAR